MISLKLPNDNRRSHYLQCLFKRPRAETAKLLWMRNATWLPLGVSWTQPCWFVMGVVSEEMFRMIRFSSGMPSVAGLAQYTAEPRKRQAISPLHQGCQVGSAVILSARPIVILSPRGRRI